MISVRSILAATDLSESGKIVLRSAADVARAFQAQLHVVYVAPPGEEPRHSAHESQLADQVSRSLTAEPLDAPLDLDIAQAIVYDRPYHGILVHAAAVDADLIVVGPHRGSSVGARWNGTTAERIVRSADVPCLVVTGSLALPLRHVGVAVDFSPSSQGAAVLAGDWLPAMSAADESPTLSLVHVASSERRAAKTRLQEEVERVSAGVLGAPPLTGIRVEGILPSGSAVAPALAEWARANAVDLLVTSTEARRGWQRMWRGSLATSLSTLAPCPVLLVPPSLWRRSPIPLSTVAVGIERTGAGTKAWAWVERMRDGAPEPPNVVALSPDEHRLRAAQTHAADLIVVHEPRMKPYERLRADLRSLLEHTPVPILVLRDLPDVPLRRILVAVDTGDLWYEKLGWAKRLADRFGAHVTIYHAVDLSLTGRVRREPGGEFLPGSSAWLDAGVEDKIVPAMTEWLWERVRLAGLDPDHVDVRVGLDAPWFAISTIAHKIEADLVIVAAHAERRPGRVRLSRVARATLERGTYSTLVVVDRARRLAEWGKRGRIAAPSDAPIEHSE